MGYSTVGKGLVRDMGYSVAGYGDSIWDMLLIGPDIEYKKLEDIHSYLDEIFLKFNTP